MNLTYAAAIIIVAFWATLAVSNPAPGQDVQRPDPFRVLVFSKTAGFRHGSIPAGVAAMRTLAKDNGFFVDATEDSAAFNDDNLSRYAAVVFLNTTGDILNDEQQRAFERYIQSGRGYVGVHSAADTEYDWPWYGKLVGAYFKSHPAVQFADVIVADRVHPSTAHLPARWQRRDEWYDYRASPRGNVHVLATIDEASYENGKMGHDHPIAWCHEFDGGRAWYTGGGHTDASYVEPAFMQHILGGVRWVAGVIQGDAGATVSANFDRVVLDDFVTDPMELAVANDGRVIFVERDGVVKVWRPDTQTTSVAGFIDVFTELEDGLLGIALDPSFDETGWFYLCYAPEGDEPKNLLSRFTMVGDTFERRSEIVMLEVVTQRDECCHSGGSIAFDAQGRLYLSTGDNTSPFASDGYTPIDEREGRSPFDAQKSSANTHDLRGKVLRIQPEPDGAYSIPSGNLFPTPEQGRPEIYAMGCRNPFRISVNPRNGHLYWGEVGPDAGSPNATRGPAGQDEFNRAAAAGNFGWPYFIGNNKRYHDYDFESRVVGAEFDPDKPINDSPNNTGSRDLPSAQPAWMWYPYGESTEFPEFGAGGRCAMAGPVYFFDPEATNAQRLPEYYDNTLFIYEWARNWVIEVKLDEYGEILKLNRFAPDISLIRPHDMELGPDGRLYIIEWGTGFGGGNADGQIVRIDYHRSGERPPRASAIASATSGSAPLEVAFSAGDSTARDGGALQYAWDFDGDGAIDSTAANPTHRFAPAGNYTTQLIVTDSNDQTSTANIPISVGNTRPVVQFQWPPDGAFFKFGDTIRYRITVNDVEDANIDERDVSMQSLLGHDTHAHPLHRLGGFDGQFQTLLEAGHGGNIDLFQVLAATYQDRGASGVAPLTGRSEIILQPARKQAEFHTMQSGVRVEKADDPDDGGQAVVFDGSGGYVSFNPMNFQGVETITARVAAGVDGETLELRLGAPDGPMLGEVVVEPSGMITLDAGAHPVRVEFFERGGGAGLIMRIKGGGLAKQVVAAEMWSHSSGEPGLATAYYELDDPISMPDFGALEPYATEVIDTINFASTNDDFAGSERSEHVGAVLTGSINIAQPGEYTFFLESDDGSKLFINDELLINNDGLHGMREMSVGLKWLDVTIPIVDPVGTHELFVVFCAREAQSMPLKLNWLQFDGPRVAVDSP